MFVAGYEEDQKREDIEHVWYKNSVSDDEDEDEGNPKQVHNSKVPVPLFRPVSRKGNLQTTNAREENDHELVSPETQLPTQPPANVIINEIEEGNMSSES